MFLSWRLRVDFTVVSSTDIVLLGLYERGFFFRVILGLCLAHIFSFILSCLEAMDLIFLMYVSSRIFTTLKGLGMFYSPDMPLQSSYFLGSLMYLGVTERY